ncbi:hypothetical protein WISP_25988 [Willisornis vidua]|uniref:Uncharacterized protein n=1 Tax=Willisornis vidua TaxID=1566151 RepID=A0ABQ9DSB8_9PASS|nr:hypothetical protein WISP_25988 [Willisornis vidua]
MNHHNAVSETGVQPTNQEVNAVPTTTCDVPVLTTWDGVQTQAEANKETVETQVANPEIAISTVPAKTTVETQPQAEANTVSVHSVETQTQAVDLKVAISTKSTGTVVQTQTQAEVNTASARSVGTQTQVTRPKITIVPIKKKTARMKETIKPIEPPPQLEREEDADEGAAAREEETAVTMEGAMAREERVVTVEEGAATREVGVVTRNRAHLMGLGEHPKESRGVSRERKETMQATQDRIALDEWYSDYLHKFPEEGKRGLVLILVLVPVLIPGLVLGHLMLHVGKLEAPGVRHRNLDGKKAVHIVEAKTQEKKHRSPRRKKATPSTLMKEPLTEHRSSQMENTSTRSNNRGALPSARRRRGTRMIIGFTGLCGFDGLAHRILRDTKLWYLLVPCTLMSSEHESTETVSISGVTEGSQDLLVVEADMSLTGHQWEKHSIVTGPEAPCILGMGYLKRGHFKDPKGYRWDFGVATVIEGKSKQLSTLPGLSEDPSVVGLL